MNDCLFCKIVNKEIDSDVVHEDERVVAFRDINPQAPTHVLVIPREHISSAAELGRDHGEVLGAIFDVASAIARDDGLSGGWRLVTNVGGDAGQSVDHVHFHVLGGRRMSWPPG